jgi:alkylhydroperoxidase family enzyme
MPLIPLYEAGDAEQEAVAEQVRARRGGTLLNLDRMLLHSAPFAAGWNVFIGKVRTDLSLPLSERELIICAVGFLNGAAYEIAQHAPILLEAGASQAQLDALSDVETASRDEALFTPAQRAILRFVLESTRSVKVSPETGAALRAAYPDPRHVAEIAGVTAAYNMVSRFLVSLEIPIEASEG